jgi:N-acyl-D-aspartate/D-glutamate deacylase
MTVMEVFSRDNEPFIGRTVGDLSSARGTDPFNAAMDIALADNLADELRAPGTRRQRVELGGTSGAAQRRANRGRWV